MEFKDFKIDGVFYTDTGKWMCVDIGTKTIIAYNMDKSIPSNIGWDVQNNHIFYWHDFGGCRLTK